MTVRLQKMFAADGQEVEVLNAGIGNYNAVRYVERFKQRLADLDPTDIVVHYFLRDAETLDAGRDNWLLRNSELAATTWIAFSRYFGKASEKTLEEHYRDVYRPDAQGYRAMRAALHDLATIAKQRGIRVYLAMTPDVHDLVDYKFGFIHQEMARVAAEEGFRYVDLLPPMRNLTPRELWSMPGDPHPNGLGHKLMAELHDRRHVGQLRMPLRRQQRERLQVAGLDLRQRRDHAGRHELRAARDEVRHRRRNARVRDHLHPEAGAAREHLGRQVGDRADRRARIRQLAGSRLRVCDEVFQCLPG